MNLIPAVYIDRDGQEITEDEWLRHSIDPTYGLIASIEFTHPGDESATFTTFWVGTLNPEGHLWPYVTIGRYQNGPPQLLGFYPTLGEAEAGHRAVVDKFATTLGEMLVP